MTLRLTKAELVEITGSHRRTKQLAWCAANGIPAVEDCHGQLVVLRAAMEARLLPRDARARSGPIRTEPDLAALATELTRRRA